MSVTIEKIRIINFKRFRDYTLEPNKRINILVGDNEVGKSSILEAIDLVASGSQRRVETIGLDRLLNVEAVKEFQAGKRTFDELPSLHIELYLSLSLPEPCMNGKNNLDKLLCDGIRLVCEPDRDYLSEIMESLREHQDYFPYDYYSIKFSTFAEEVFTPYKKKLHVALIDSANMNSGYVTNDFVRRIYMQYTETNKKERIFHKSEYRILRNDFRSKSLGSLNQRVPAEKGYSFGLKNYNSMDLENDLMIYENDISIDYKGAGRQVFVKTDFAMERVGDSVDVILMEEPENHLSPVNLRKLIQRVAESQAGQIFITTHSSLISTRLELLNLLILHRSSEERPTSLKELSDDTAQYFMKAPPAGIVEYALAQNVVLVEGPSEYMLFERFYRSMACCLPEKDNVHLICVRGLSFRRYLEIAMLTKNKVAVITDNDGDFQRNCIDKYRKYDESNIKIFYDKDNNKRTFEIVLFNDNPDLCTRLFGTDACEYMLKNKTEVAYKLLSQDSSINVPRYISEAIEWIRG